MKLLIIGVLCSVFSAELYFNKALAEESNQEDRPSITLKRVPIASWMYQIQGIDPNNTTAANESIPGFLVVFAVPHAIPDG